MRGHWRRACTVGGLLAATAVLPGCAGDSGSDGGAGAGASSALEGTWSGTWSQGTPSFPTGVTTALHATEGEIAITLTRNDDGSYAGQITLRPDICATEADDTAGQPAVGIALTVTVSADRVDMAYDSEIDTAVADIRLAAPNPPGVTWEGSYDGTTCGTDEASLPNWKGDFSLSKS